MMHKSRKKEMFEWHNGNMILTWKIPALINFMIWFYTKTIVVSGIMEEDIMIGIVKIVSKDSR